MESATTVLSKRHLDSQQNNSPMADDAGEQVQSSREQSPTSVSHHAKKLKSMGEQPGFGYATARRTFKPEASIVLVGIRGTGKSSIALIASTALGFRLLDADQYFHQHTGLSRAAFRNQYGNAEYRKREQQIMRSMLVDYQSNCVIACGPGSIEGTGRAILMEYAKAHPVIYILRDTSEIQRYLNVWSSDTVKSLIEMTGPTYRALSNFEFYNLSESSPQVSDVVPSGQKSGPQVLTLKTMEQAFLRFLSSCINPKVGIAERVARHVLALTEPELKPFTYALQLPLTSLSTSRVSVGELDTTADIIELIIDVPLVHDGKQVFDHALADSISRQYFAIRQHAFLPILFHAPLTLASTSQNGFQQQDSLLEKAYFDLLHHALRLAPKYITVDLNCDARQIRNLIAAKGSTKIVGHCFDRNSEDDGWTSLRRKSILQKAIDLGCDLVRLCQGARSWKDNVSIQQFVQEHKASRHASVPLIVYNTEPLGRLSCWQNRIFSPVTHSVFRASNNPLDSRELLTIKEAQNALYASFTLDQRYFGVYGEHVAASLSPAIHNAAFRYTGMPHDYRIFQQTSLHQLKYLFQDPQFGGASVSAPFKTEIISMIDILSPDAQAIGAVNTVIPLRSKDSKALLERNRAGQVVALYGENTDWIGIHASIRRNLSPINAVVSSTTGLVLGAGGMARAAIYALKRLGVQNIFVHNRSTENARQLAAHFDQDQFSKPPMLDPLSTSGTADHVQNVTKPKINILASMKMPWPAEYQLPTMIVSCVPAHDSKTKSLTNIKLPQEWLESATGGVFIELVYQPLETPLLKQIQALSINGWIVVDGLQVLPEQGISQFEVFTGRKAPLQLMRETLLRYYNEHKDNLDEETSVIQP